MTLISYKKITISGLAGVGKGTTARLLAKKLAWQALSGGDMFREMASEQGLPLNEFEDLTKKDPQFDLKLDQRIKEFGESNENFVFESRLAWYFIPDAFKIKLSCNYEERTRRIAQREKKDIAVVKEETDHREEAIKERYKKYYDIDNWHADENFDLIVDTTHTPPDGVVAEILENLS
jgi:cytidylate kinase